MASLRVIISGGGTGGHIFPAIAIANAIKKKRPDTKFLFVGAEGRMEMTKVPEAGYKIIGLPIMGLQRSMSIKNLKFPFKLIKSMRKAKKLVKSFKPDVAIGVGGYASGPMLRAASKAKVPTLLQEQNSFAGLTNKILGRKADKICVAYENMDQFFPKDKIVITGNPVREEMVTIDQKQKAAEQFFGLDPNKKTVLIFGGSLGAWSINEAVALAIEEFKKQDIQLIWQTGKLYYEKALSQLTENESSIKVYEFIKRMDYAYAAADLVVSRAGAIAVSELCLVKKPTIFVPLPSAAEDHQTKNAMVLVNRNAAELIDDKEVRIKLGEKVCTLVQDQKALDRMSRQMEPMGFHDAANIIADEAIKLAIKA